MQYLPVRQLNSSKQCNIISYFNILTLLGGIFWIFFACQQGDQADKEPLYSEALSRLISHATSGVISPDDSVRIQFIKPVIPREKMGQPVERPLLQFKPPIKGEAYWSDQKSLIFKPAEALPLQTSYAGELQLKALPGAPGNLMDQSFKFNFQVAGREIAVLTSDFHLLKADDPKNVFIKGHLEFTVTTRLASLKSAASLMKDKQSLKLEWQAAPGGKKFHFQSEAIQRSSKKELRLSLEILQKPLALSGDYQKIFQLAVLGKMTVQQVKIQDKNKQTGIIVEFSDELDAQQDLTGLISAAPENSFKLAMMGRKVFLDGAFQRGQQYTLKVNKGVRSRWGTFTQKGIEKKLVFKDLKPQLKFSSDGVFLPAVNQQKIRFQTLNLKNVRLVIKRVFESNLGQFLQTEQLYSNKIRRKDFSWGYVNRVGVDIFSDTLAVGAERNIWKQHELDLSQVFQKNDKGLYLIMLQFLQEDMLYENLDELRESQKSAYYGDAYYSNPYSEGYVYTHGHIYKPVVISDIGLTYKKGHQQHRVWATGLSNVAPLAGVEVTLRSYQNQVLASQLTDARGYAEFSSLDTSASVFWVEAEKGGQRSVIKLNEMAWNMSTFDTKGAEAASDGVRAFIYTERGVYRPGDEVNIVVIARNSENTFPENHPVNLIIYNPKNQKIYEQTHRKSKDGFYHFPFQSTVDDPTGNWKVEALVGSKTFFHTLKIEMVVPYRLKIRLIPEKEVLTADDQWLNAKLNSAYLFGSPAANLRAEVKLRLYKINKTFSRYSGYMFSNETMDYKASEHSLFKGRLNMQGNADIQWRLPGMEGVPSALMAILNTRVWEKGGRPNLSSVEIPIDPYSSYVGIQKPELEYGYMQLGATLKLPVVLVNRQGEMVSGNQLMYRIYKGKQYWWWEYDEQDKHRLRYKTDKSTELILEDGLMSQQKPVHLSFTPEKEGRYFIEIQDGKSGHCAGIFIDAYPWGESPATGKNAGLLALKADKPAYQVGENAVIHLPTPSKGKVLLSIEKGQKILNTLWHIPDSNKPETKISIPITGEMVPTAYVTVSIIQPHQQTLNDRPMRMYGVVALNVENTATHRQLKIEMPDEIRSNASFQVKLKTLDDNPTQFTIAVVDEGLLGLTRFSTPDPWQYFFQKQRLGVMTYDLFSYVIGANKGDVFRTFSIGGDLGSEYRKSQLTTPKKRRFKPVSMFKGPLETDLKGRASMTFNMPNYVGAVRVMVVAADNQHYGRAEKRVPVKTDLLLLPTLPRVIGPEDKVRMPVSVWAMKEKTGRVKVQLQLEGPLQSAGNTQKTVDLNEIGEKEIDFEIQANAEIGQGKIILIANAAGKELRHETDIEIRASSPKIYGARREVLEIGKPVILTVPEEGLPGSNKAHLSIQTWPEMNVTNRLLWLIRYPYGCIEQSVSSVFPQLYLKMFLKDIRNPKSAERDIDANINAGIDRLQRFQLASGAFAYWPGNRDFSAWGTNYAGHFMIEAKKLGYNVPKDLFEKWLRFQKSRTTNIRSDLMIRVYRVYLLALAGKPAVGAMNLLKENNLKDMSDTEKWLLASAYQMAGVKRMAQNILKAAGKKVRKYQEPGGTYGSGLRDRAMILDALTGFEIWPEAEQIARELMAALSKEHWYSTQTTAFMLTAVGKFIKAQQGKGEKAPRLAGTVILPNKEKIAFDSGEHSVELPLNEGFGKELQIILSRESTVMRAFAVLSWSGVPLKSGRLDQQKNLNLSVEWLDESGRKMNPAVLKQGTSFWGHFRVSSPQRHRRIEELALLQVLPAGWEIENTRLPGVTLPLWMRKWRTGQEEYYDIRDDRISWFFDLEKNHKEMDFVVKLNAVTAGEFHLPVSLVEAMYDRDYQAIKTWPKVKVLKRK